MKAQSLEYFWLKLSLFFSFSLRELLRSDWLAQLAFSFALLFSPSTLSSVHTFNVHLTNFTFFVRRRSCVSRSWFEYCQSIADFVCLLQYFSVSWSTNSANMWPVYFWRFYLYHHCHHHLLHHQHPFISSFWYILLLFVKEEVPLWIFSTPTLRPQVLVKCSPGSTATRCTTMISKTTSKRPLLRLSSSNANNVYWRGMASGRRLHLLLSTFILIFTPPWALVLCGECTFPS